MERENALYRRVIPVYFPQSFTHGNPLGVELVDHADWCRPVFDLRGVSAQKLECGGARLPDVLQLLPQPCNHRAAALAAYVDTGAGFPLPVIASVLLPPTCLACAGAGLPLYCAALLC